jgi:hypothetical protein
VTAALLTLAGLWWSAALARRWCGRAAVAGAIAAIAGGSFVAWYALVDSDAARMAPFAASAGLLALWLRLTDRRPALGRATPWALVAIPVACSTPYLLAPTTAVRVADVLWSSENGLFATSPALYLGAIGLLGLWRADRPVLVGGLGALAALAILIGAQPPDPQPAGYGGYRFAALVPLLTVGLAMAATAAARWVARRPAATAAAGLAVLVVWNVTLAVVARGNGYRIGQPVSFGDLGAAQAAVLHDWIGHPPSYPAALLFAAREGVAPGRYDLMGPDRFLRGADDVERRIDVGDDDADALAGGWHQAERSPDGTFRWATGEAGVLVSIDHAADLTVRVRLLPYDYPEAPPQRLFVAVNGRQLAPVTLATGWQELDVAVPAEAWRSGVNRLVLRFDRQTRPSDVDGTDARPLAAAVDWIGIRR